MKPNKAALVTGARRGIGMATVRKLAANGINVWACARHQDPVFEQTLKRIECKTHSAVRPLYFDLSDSGQMKTAIGTVRNNDSLIDILVNCAGVIAQSSSFSMTTRDNLLRTIDINLLRQIELTQYVLRMMGDGGAIINVSSIAAHKGMPGQYGYACSKAAVEIWTKMLAQEIAPRGIRVNAVSAGLVSTAMANSANDDTFQELVSSCALKRIANPDEIADAILYLSSDHASFVTGTVLSVDGGRL